MKTIIKAKDCGNCPFHIRGSEYPSSECAASGCRPIYPMGYWREGKEPPTWCPLPVVVKRHS